MNSIIKTYSIIFLLSLFSASSSYASNACQGYADIVEPLIPAVVNISITGQKDLQKGQIPPFPEGSQLEEFNKLFEHFGQIPEEDEESAIAKPSSSGSGFIISSDGYIVTNYHVIDEAEKIVVTLSNDQKLDAKLIGFDNRTDLALLKVESKTALPFVKFGNSDENRVGDAIIAIGNPFGLGGTVTAGIISSQARDLSTSSSNIIDNFIQTDAAINRGNSGGPMFNTKGEVIGINFAIVSPTGNNIGIGFAVPSSVAKPIVEQLMKDGKVHHGWIGVAIQPTDEVAESLGLKEGVGSLISNIATGSPAEKAGIQIGDIILKFDGKEITNFKKLPRIVAGTPVGTKVSVELMSKGKLKNITLTVGEIDAKIEASAVNNNISPKAVKSLYGMNLSSITPEIRKILNIPNDINGVFVSSLDKKSLAAKHGIKAGDVINSANQKLLKKPEDLFSIIEEAKTNQRKSIMLLINRAGGNVFLSLPVTK